MKTEDFSLVITNEVSNLSVIIHSHIYTGAEMTLIC